MRYNYIFEFDFPSEDIFHKGVENTLDTSTVLRIRQLGDFKGKDILELGAGGGSIAKYLKSLAGKSGNVVACDIKTKYLEHLESEGITVLELDVSTADFGVEKYDFIHMRLLLANLPEAPKVLKKIVKALKKGGFLLIEEYDFSTRVCYPESELVNKVDEAHRIDMRNRKGDPNIGKKLFSYFKENNLKNVTVKAESFLGTADSSSRKSRKIGWSERKNRMIDSDLLTEYEIDEFIKLLDDENYIFMSPILFQVAGVK